MNKHINFKHYAAFLSGLSLFMTCPHIVKKNTYQWKPFVHTNFAHRGFHDNAWGVPENSLPAFDLAVKKNYGIELDVHLTADDQLVIIHDDDLNRMCHVDRTIKDMTLKEIQKYHLLNTSERIPTLEDVLTHVNGKVPLLIELKSTAYNCKHFCSVFKNAIQQYHGPYIIESFNPMILHWFRKKEPNILRGQLSCNFFKEKPHCDLVLFLISVLGSNFLARPDFISYKYTDYKNPFVWLNCHLFGARLALWTITSPDTMQTVKKTSDMIIFEGFEP